MVNKIGCIDVESKFPLVGKNEHHGEYGIEVICESGRDARLILRDHTAELRELVDNVRGLVLRVDGDFSMNGTIQGVKIASFPDRSLAFHCDLHLHSDSSRNHPEVWSSNTALLWQNARKIGRAATTVCAEPKVVLHHISEVLNDPKYSQLKAKINEHGLEFDELYERQAMILSRWWEQNCYPDSNKPKSATAKVMALRDIQVDNDCLLVAAQRESDRALGKLIAASAEIVYERMQGQSLSVDWSTAESARGKLLMLTGGVPNATEKPLVRARINHLGVKLDWRDAVYVANLV